MIEFSGKISDIVKKKILKKRDRKLGYIFLIITITAIVATTVLGILKNESFVPFIICTLILISITVILIISPASKKLFRFKWDCTVRVDFEKVTIICPLFNREITKPVAKIRKVIDGDCYYLVYSDIGNAYICQKDLIAKGTIEEFESIFAGKIRRKNKNKGDAIEK